MLSTPVTNRVCIAAGKAAKSASQYWTHRDVIAVAIGAAERGRLGAAARRWIDQRRIPGAWKRWASGVQSAAASLRLQNVALIPDCATLSISWRRQQLHSAPQGQIGNGVANLVFYTSSIFRQSHVE
jgi:hypothetical protein